MRRPRYQNNIINQMNVVPYIDVMLVLLVIFMITAPLFSPGVINLPSVGAANAIKIKTINISIDKDYNYSLTQDNQNLKVKNLDELVDKIVELNHDTQIVISADKNIKYDSVINVVNKLYSHGVKKVALVVKRG